MKATGLLNERRPVYWQADLTVILITEAPAVHRQSSRIKLTNRKDVNRWIQRCYI